MTRPTRERLARLRHIIHADGLQKIVNGDEWRPTPALELFAEIDALNAEHAEALGKQNNALWDALNRIKDLEAELSLARERLGPAGMKLLQKYREMKKQSQIGILALKSVLLKNPSAVGRDEAADMAVEFHMVAHIALAEILKVAG